MEGPVALELEELTEGVETDEVSYCSLISGVTLCCVEVIEEAE